MSLNKLYVFLTFLFSSTFLFSNCPDGTDVCLSIEDNNLNYESTTDIAGFQFNIEGVEVLDAFGGLAGDNNFTMNVGQGTVLGFSFSVKAVATREPPRGLKRSAAGEVSTRPAVTPPL